MQGLIEQLRDWIDTHLNKKILAILAASLTLVAFWLGGAYTHWQEKDQGLTLAKPATTEVSKEASNTNEKSAAPSSSKVKVHIVGAVANAGVYTLTTDDRIDDAVRAAGVTANADLSKLNLAQHLSDGQKIIVPAYGEVAPAVTSQGATTDGSASVNINTASEKELMTLSGVGEVRAQSIIAYREEHGGFRTIEELKEVSGIGEKSFEQLAPHVTL